MSPLLNRCIAKLVLFFLMFNLVPFQIIGSSYAVDGDGTNNLDLTITSQNTVTSILGDNFNINFTLKNESTSEGTAYKIGYLVNIPTGITFVSSDLGSPSQTLTTSGSTTTLVFETTNSLLEGISENHSLVLSGETGIGNTQQVRISSYANDNIYGRGPVPDGAPVSTLPGGVDLSNGGTDPSITFPDDITTSTDLSLLGFEDITLGNIPFNVTKNSSGEALVGNTFSTTLLIEGNNKGDLKNFYLRDVIPSNREFLGFTQTGANIGNIDILYNTPSSGQTTLNLSNITVPQGTDLDIRYNTRILTHTILSNTGGVITFNTGSIVNENSTSSNSLDLITGSGTWSDGSSDILVDGSTKPSQLPQSISTTARFSQLSKSVDKPQSVIGDSLVYTINFASAKNVTFTTTGSGTYIEDIIPDGISFVSDSTSTVSSGSALTFIGSSIIGSGIDQGNTILTWRLNSGTIPADSTGIITYNATVDGIFEGGLGEQEYENTETLTNTATLYATIGTTLNTGDWGYTDSSIMGDITTYSDTATITAPNPTIETRLISIETPDSTIYGDGNTAYNTGVVVPVGSTLEFVMSMDFPNVAFINAHLLNALPLLTGHNENIYDIEFQNNNSLNDIYGVAVKYNTNDGITPATTYNGLSLSGSIIPNASWISISEPNNIEFDLGSGDGGNTFSIKFKVDILPDAPETIPSDGLHPLLDASIGDFSNDIAVKQSALLNEFIFNINTPFLSIDKSVTAIDVEAGSDVVYQIIVKNEGKASAYAENIIDIMPDNMSLESFNFSYSGSLSSLPNSLVTQSGSQLLIEYNTGATLGKSISPIDTSGTTTIDESIILLNYTLTPDQNFVINNDEKINTVSLDYYATPDIDPKEVYNYGPITATDNFTSKQPTITREIISTSETNSVGLNDLEIGEEVTFRTTITLPGGTYTSSSFTEDLYSQLEFLTGSVVSSSGSISFSTGTGFTANSVNFGTITNTDTNTGTLETIVIETQARSKNTSSRGSNRKAEGEFYYNSLNTTINTPVDIIEPLLNITKSVSPTTADAGDNITYTINITHNGSSNASAYDIVLKDVIAGANIQYSSGTLAGISNFTGTENELFSGTGLILPVLLDGNTETITFNALILTGALAGTNERNNVTLDYSTLDDDGSIYEKNKSKSSYVDLNIADVSITHSITATDNIDTNSSKFIGGNTDAAIGEYVTYQIDVSLPELGFTDFTITQDLPVGIKFLTGSVVGDNVKTHTLNTITISPDNKIIFDFGDIDNIGVGTGTGFTLSTTVVVLDNVANSAGNIKNSLVTADFNTTYSKTNNTPNFDIVEPNIVITKDYSPNIGDAGDIIPTTITIQNTGTAPAYDVAWTDDLAPKTTSSGAYLASSSTGVLLPGASITYNYDSVLDNTVTYGDNLTGTASVVYSSLSGTPVEGERSYNSTDTDIITVVTTSGVSKVLTTSNEIKIGDTTGYEIKVPVLEGSTNNVVITDEIPTGLLINSGSIIITTSAGVVYSGTVTPVIDISSETIIAGQNQTVTYSFTDIVNSDVDNGTIDYLIINYNTVLANTADNNANDVKSEPVQADYNSGTTILTGSVQPVTIYEQEVYINTYLDYSNGYLVSYYVSIENETKNGPQDIAFDVNIESFLPTGLSFSGAPQFTNTGNGFDGYTQTGSILNFDRVEYNEGNPLQLRYNLVIDESISDGVTLTVSGSLTHTSQNGVYTPIISNIINTERNGDKTGSNDYHDTDSDNITVTLAILNEDISVVDINGGVGIIGDIFEYTITLTNTGSVNLTDIEVNHSIPSSFTGFTITSTPIGSTDNSTATGGTNNAGNLAFSGVTLNIGEIKTIVYRVTAKTDVTPGTTVNTKTNVSNTPQGALGGTPDVDVVINAPRLVSTITETDDNGGSLYVNEYITHTATIQNTGTSTGTNLVTSISYSTGTVEYLSGSLTFASGSLINTGSVVINTSNNTIDFIIDSIASSITETFSFRTKAIGNPGNTVTSYLTGVVDEGINTTSISNTLVIVEVKRSGGGGGGGGGYSSRKKDNCPNGDYTSSKYDSTCGEKSTDGEIPTEEKPKENPEDNPEDKDLPKVPKIIDKEKVIETVKKYKELEEKLKKLIKEEELEGTSLLKALPKILPKTGTAISDRIQTKTYSKIDTSLPDNEIFRLAGSKNIDLNYWLQVLPEEDKNKSKYIIIPSNGLVIGVNDVSNGSLDFDKMINGREIDVNKYLQSGTVEYPGTSTRGFGEVGNKVIFGHSSYWKTDEGRYKTHFQKIIELDENEQVWIYEKQSNGIFKRFKYIVIKSYNTDDSDTSVLTPGKGKNLTLFTCTPIGGVSGRWIIKAKYVDEVISELKNKIEFNDVSFKYKIAIRKLVTKIRNIENPDKKQEILGIIYNKIDLLLEKNKSNEKLSRIFELLQLEISKEILN